MDFDYEKAWFVFCKPEWGRLDKETLDLHGKLAEMVKELAQKKDLNIPVSDEMRELLKPVGTETLASLARLSYFAGHWKPANVKPLFENSSGQSWKVANVIDQALRERFRLPYNILIYKGKFRVFFSNRNCRIWEEFSLATEQNLKTFENSGHFFGEFTLYASAHELRKQIGDLYPPLDDAVKTVDYLEFLKKKEELAICKLEQNQSIINL